MRADRIVAALLVLQARGRVTAAQLSQELEISVRTARRDLEALALAGVPVYPQRGRGGGWSLVGGARTDLSGLTAEEARALLLVAGPSAATPSVRAAIRKLIQALPEPFRADADAAATAVVVDASGWDRAARPAPPHLGPVQRATIEGRVIRLRYRGRDGAETERLVHPLGLVAKGSTWYLVGDTEVGLRTFRLDRVRSVGVTDEPVRRPPDFNLEDRWAQILAEIEDRRFSARARGRADPDLLGVLRSVFGTRLTVGHADATRWVDIEVRGWSETVLARELAGFAEHVEVSTPAPVRRHLARLGATLVATYGSDRRTVPATTRTASSETRRRPPVGDDPSASHQVHLAWQGDRRGHRVDRRPTSPGEQQMTVRGVFQNATSTRTVPAGAAVFNEGDTGNEMYGIISGAIELRISGGATFDLGPEDVFGEMALVDASPRMATAIATADTELAVIDRRRFLFLVTETPTFALQVMAALAQRLRAQET